MKVALRLTLVASVLCSIATLAYAQGFFGLGGSSNNAAKPAASSAQVLSAEQFKQAVNQRNKQVQANVAQQAARVQASIPPPPRIKDDSGNQTATNAPTRPVAQPLPPPPAMQSQMPQQTPQQAAPVDTYSGFGAGNQNNSNSGTNNNSQGGWGITY